MPAERNVQPIPLVIKLLGSGLFCLIVPVYWVKLGPTNFLWFSDIALFVITLALWLENRFLASMMTVGGLIPELIWNIDFLLRLASGSHLFGLGATAYMFDPQVPLFIRSLSLVLHVYLLVMFIWLACRLRHHPKAWIGQTILAWIILPVCYGLTEPADNINFVFGPGAEPQQWLPAPLYVALLMLMIPLLIYFPTHLLLDRFFSWIEVKKN